ncbi:hypothetical protein ACTFIY_008900 [Dictyostelium cf. discoideum]
MIVVIQGLEVVTVLVNDIGTFTSNNCYFIFRLFLLFSSGSFSLDDRQSPRAFTTFKSGVTGNIPRSIDQTISRVNTNPDSTTLETEDYSTFQSHIRSIFGPQKARRYFRERATTTRDIIIVYSGRHILY